MPSNYSLMDATLEILLMLLVAFLLGWLFCWLMKRLFGRKDEAEYTHNIKNPDLNLQPSGPERTGLSASSRKKLYDPEIGIPDADIDADVPTVKEPKLEMPDIKAPDVDVKTPRPRIDIPDLKTPDIELPDLDIKGKVDTGLNVSKEAIGKGLGAAAAGIGAVAAGASALKEKPVDAAGELDLNLNKPDVEMPDVDVSLPDVDLPKVEVGGTELPDVNLPEINTEELTASVDLPDAPDLAADIGLPEVGPSDLTAKVDLPEINVASSNTDLPDVDLPSVDTTGISDTVDGGKDLLDKGLDTAAAGLGAVTAGAAALKGKATEKIDELGDKLTQPELPKRQDGAKTDNRVSSNLGDDLTKISGIDSSVAALLASKGINTFKKLQDTDRDTLKAYIEEAGGDVRSIEPASWPHQAKLCAEKNWAKLAEYKTFLSGKSEDMTAPDTASGGVAKDDLKKIEGIGPFFEGLLNKAGITTYKQLKNSDRDTLKRIIDAAGPNYRMHEPETWPYQAGLADQGDWKKLRDYINFMTGRN